jgi:hypothetical protein
MLDLKIERVLDLVSAIIPDYSTVTLVIPTSKSSLCILGCLDGTDRASAVLDILRPCLIPHDFEQ